MEALIERARQEGYFLNNLFELRDSNTCIKGNGRYQANFRHESGHQDFGRGNTPHAALEDALERCRGKQGPDNRSIIKAAKSPTEDMSALL